MNESRVSPIPAEPSAQSARMLASRIKHERFGRMGPGLAHGVGLRLMRLTMWLPGVLGRMPAGASARTVRFADPARSGKQVRGRWASRGETDKAVGVQLWLHGGAFVAGTPRLTQTVADLYGKHSGRPTFLPYYRRAPEHPFPAAADDVLAAYRALLGQGYPAESIRVIADSAGGYLALGLLGDLGRAGLPQPGAVLLHSPVIDLGTQAAKQHNALHRDPSVDPAMIEATNRRYYRDTPLSDPRLDVLAADMRDWPPMLIQVGGTECLVAEAQLLAQAMDTAGAQCELQIWPGQVHAFSLVGGNRIPEAIAARNYAAEFLADPPA